MCVRAMRLLVIMLCLLFLFLFEPENPKFIFDAYIYLCFYCRGWFMFL